MAPTRKSSLELEDALLRVGDRLGMRVLLLRLVAAELPDNPWLLDLEIESEGPEVTVHTTHLCGEACNGDLTGCLTAFKVEDAVTKRLGEEFALAAIERVNADRLQVRLHALTPRSA